MNSFANGWQPPNNVHSLSLLYLHLTNPTGVLRTFSMTSSVEHTHTRTQSQSVLFILSIDLQLVQEPPKQLANKHRTGQTPSICIPHVFAANWAEARACACACACGTITLNTHGVITKCQLGAGHSRQTKTEPVMCVIECVWCGFGSAKSSSRGWPPPLLLLLLLGHARTPDWRPVLRRWTVRQPPSHWQQMRSCVGSTWYEVFVSVRVCVCALQCTAISVSQIIASACTAKCARPSRPIAVLHSTSPRIPFSNRISESQQRAYEFDLRTARTFLFSYLDCNTGSWFYRYVLLNRMILYQ